MLASALMVRKRATLWRATGALVVLGPTYVLPAPTLQAVDNLARVGREVRYGSFASRANHSPEELVRKLT
jgi:hypothetical protein